MATSEELTAAIAELAKTGMAFTSEVGSDGNKIYIVDSVALSEEELLLLYKNHALNENGIRHYLAYRGAFSVRTDPTTAHIPFVTFFQLLVGAMSLNVAQGRHLDNCAECRALAEELTHTDRGTIRPDPLPRKKTDTRS